MEKKLSLTVTGAILLLLSACKMAVIPGVVPSNPGALIGCPFAPRCEFVFERCTREVPALFQISAGHASACFLADPSTTQPGGSNDTSG